MEKNKVVAKQNIKERVKLKFMKREVPKKEMPKMEMPPKLEVEEKMSKIKVPRKLQDKLDKKVVKNDMEHANTQEAQGTWNQGGIFFQVAHFFAELAPFNRSTEYSLRPLDKV